MTASRSGQPAQPQGPDPRTRSGAGRGRGILNGAPSLRPDNGLRFAPSGMGERMRQR